MYWAEHLPFPVSPKRPHAQEKRGREEKRGKKGKRTVPLGWERKQTTNGKDQKKGERAQAAIETARGNPGPGFTHCNQFPSFRSRDFPFFSFPLPPIPYYSCV